MDASLSLEESEFLSIKMYPNPNKDVLTIVIKNASFLLQDIIIYDTLGKTIQSFSNIHANSTTISTKDFSPGLYVVEIVGSTGKRQINKLIIN